MASATFKRVKIVKTIQKYTRFMEDAKHEMEDYALRERTAAGDDAAKYYAELKEQYRVKYQTFGTVVADLKYEFGVTPEEMDA